jgi:hypothetical protein
MMICFKDVAHSSLAEGFVLSGGDSLSFSLDVMDFRKFFMPSPKDFPNSGSLRAPKIMTIIDYENEFHRSDRSNQKH